MSSFVISCLLCLWIKLINGDLFENCEETVDGIVCTDDITEQFVTNLTCKYWLSDKVAPFGAPIDVCFGSFGGAVASSISTMYQCSPDKQNVYFYQYIGSTNCSGVTPNLINTFQFDTSDPGNSFLCDGDPCPYFTIQDGTAHPTTECPYDVSDRGVFAGGYATWDLRFVLVGCQTFNNATSKLLTCDSNLGIVANEYSDPLCSDLIKNETFIGPVCNVGTGRSFFCSDETDAPTMNTKMPSISPVMGAPSIAPTLTPSISPSMTPTETPTTTPSMTPTMSPSEVMPPSSAPTSTPSTTPTSTPTDSPNTGQVSTPSNTPTNTPTASPTEVDTPTSAPTIKPSTSSMNMPSNSPSDASISPTTSPQTTLNTNENMSYARQSWKPKWFINILFCFVNTIYVLTY